MIGTAIARPINDLFEAALIPLSTLPIGIFQFDAFGLI
ncbi:hypothetical protein NB231_06206 [Nitrococcus mobilis Nb-231]|uniref:Uncharacterized protein n=1 Tax=Nitrococcus mobilis Nb-231 TaxID=314278 RepID=A4BQV8_9GAMM|nr:hypothetical protein NB231_06206 [Nitrococcus mobilis Nb-231]